MTAVEASNSYGSHAFANHQGISGDPEAQQRRSWLSKADRYGSCLLVPTDLPVSLSNTLASYCRVDRTVPVCMYLCMYLSMCACMHACSMCYMHVVQSTVTRITLRNESKPYGLTFASIIYMMSAHGIDPLLSLTSRQVAFLTFCHVNRARRRGHRLI